MTESPQFQELQFNVSKKETLDLDSLTNSLELFNSPTFEQETPLDKLLKEEQEYRDNDAISQSDIKKFKTDGPEEYYKYKILKESTQPTAQMLLGTAYHLALFEPEKFQESVFVIKGTPPTSEQQKAFCDKVINWFKNNPHKDEIDEDTLMIINYSIYSDKGKDSAKKYAESKERYISLYPYIMEAKNSAGKIVISLDDYNKLTACVEKCLQSRTISNAHLEGFPNPEMVIYTEIEVEKEDFTLNTNFDYSNLSSDVEVISSSAEELNNDFDLPPLQTTSKETIKFKIKAKIDTHNLYNIVYDSNGKVIEYSIVLGDLKTTSAQGLRQTISACYDLGYNLQAAFYTYCLIKHYTEKYGFPPKEVTNLYFMFSKVTGRLYTVSFKQETLDKAMKEIKKILLQIHKCQTENTWLLEHLYDYKPIQI